MKFADFIHVNAIKADMSADDKPGVIRELVESLVATAPLRPESRKGSSRRS